MDVIGAGPMSQQETQSSDIVIVSSKLMEILTTSDICSLFDFAPHEVHAQLYDPEACLTMKEQSRKQHIIRYNGCNKGSDYASTLIMMKRRLIVADWLLEVITENHREKSSCRLDDVFILSMMHFDRYMATHSVNASKLQLVAITCCILASKTIDVYPLTTTDMLIGTVHYSHKQFQKMEKDILQSFNWDVNWLTVNDFTDHIVWWLNLMQPGRVDIYTMRMVRKISSQFAVVAMFNPYLARCVDQIVISASIVITLIKKRLLKWDPIVYATETSHVDQAPNEIVVRQLESVVADCIGYPVGTLSEITAKLHDEVVKCAKMPLNDHT